MARTPTIVDSARRTVFPTATLQVEGGSPAAFGSAIGQGLSDVGDAGQQATSAISYFQRAKQEEADQAAEFDRKAQFVDFGAAEDQRLTESARNVSGPALDFTKGFMSSFDQRSKEFLASVPKQHQEEWRVRFAQLRGSLSGVALKTEFNQRDAWTKTTTNDRLDKLQNGITQSPDSLDAYRAQGEDLINSSLMPQQDKLERLSKWRADAALAAGLGDVQLDPKGALNRLGGVTPVTVRSPDGTTSTISTQPVKPNGTLADNIVAGLKSRGLTDAQARGVAAGIAAESANNVGAKNNDGGGQGAFGLGQWRGSRLAALRKQYGPNPTGSQQLDFLVSELHGGDAGGAAVIGQSDEVAVLHHYIHDFMRPSAAGGEGDMKRGLSALGREVVAHAEAASTRLRQPEKGRTYNQEDAIQELGMTADEAKTFVDTGKMPTREASDTQATGAVTAPEIDPRYADLPLSARMQLIGAAQREIEHRDQLANAAEQKDHDAKVNQLLLDIDDGKAGRADIAAARKAGWLSDYSDVNRAEGILDARDKASEDLNRFNTMIGTPGFTFNQFDEDQKKAVEAGVKAQGGTPMAAFNVWQRTGILAEAGSVAIRGALISTDPKSVQGAASIASNMLEKNPNAFAGVTGGEDIEKTALLYRHQIADLGRNPDQAAQAIAAQNTPTGKAKINANADVLAAFKKDIRGAHIESALGEAFGGWFRSFDPTFTSPEQVAAVRQDYADIASDHFEQFGDPAAAKSYAATQLKKMYGVVDGRLMKYPPTRSYPAINGSHDYVFQQAADDIKAATGHAVDPKNVYLLPLPTATAEAFRSGRPVPYSVHYMDEVDGQKVYRVLNGKAFVADVNSAKTKAEREHKAAFDSARQGRQGSGVGFGIDL